MYCILGATTFRFGEGPNYLAPALPMTVVFNLGSRPPLGRWTFFCVNECW